MDAIKKLIEEVREEATREEFPVDEAVYKAAKLNPLEPILFYGSLKAGVCFFARDLGKDEVKARQPLYGAAGSLVRQGIHKAISGDHSDDKEKLQQAADRVLLMNTVPYKPPGNKAYPVKVKKRFRPFLERLLVDHWSGSYIITLGTEAFKWFAPYTEKGALDKFFKQEDEIRYGEEIEVCLRAERGRKSKERKVLLAPLPHPSPLNQKYYHLFPGMLAKRLAKVGDKL